MYLHKKILRSNIFSFQMQNLKQILGRTGFLLLLHITFSSFISVSAGNREICNNICIAFVDSSIS